jgi:ankyrin repeat protein
MAALEWYGWTYYLTAGILKLRLELDIENLGFLIDRIKRASVLAVRAVAVAVLAVAVAVGRCTFQIVACLSLVVVGWLLQKRYRQRNFACNAYPIHFNQGPSLNVADFAAWFGANNDGEWVKEKDEDGWTPLHLGMQHNAPEEVIRLLVEAWAAGVGEKDRHGRTPLHYGIEHNAPAEVVQILIEGWPEGGKTKDADGKTPLHYGMVYEAPAETIRLLVDAWSEGVKDKDKDGMTPLHYGMQNNAPVDAIKLLVEACPEGVKEKNANGSTLLHLGMKYNAPVEVIKLLVEACPEGVKEKDKTEYGNTPLHIGMLNKASAKMIKLLVEVWPAGVKEKNKKGKTPMEGTTAGMMDILFTAERSEQATAASSTITAARYHQLITTHQLQHPPSPNAPLSERMAPIKDVLSLCLQTELQFATPTLHATCDFHPYQQLYLDPAIELICAELERVRANISTNPDVYRTLLASLSTEDRKIYNACFEKSVNVDLGGDPETYATMLERCAALKAECEFVQVDKLKQPTSDLIPLVLMVREQIPTYKAIVQGVVDQVVVSRGLVTEDVATLEAKLVETNTKLDKRKARLLSLELKKGDYVCSTRTLPSLATITSLESEIDALHKEIAALPTQIAAAKACANGMNIIYRPVDQTKSPYRMVEKALTKGPNREYPDCSQILDVFGCIIECHDYAAMAAVVDAFVDQHKSGAVSIARMKDRWKNPSEGGWRDLMLNIVVNGKVVFEVQVVLHAMLVARSAMEAHTAYNQFRSFAEVFGLLELSMEVVATAAVDGGGKDGGDEWDAGAASGAAAATTTARVVELEAKVARLEGKVAAVEAEKAAADGWNTKLEAKVTALTAETAIAEAKVAAAVVSERAAVEIERDADRQQFEAKVAELHTQLAARD